MLEQVDGIARAHARRGPRGAGGRRRRRHRLRIGPQPRRVGRGAVAMTGGGMGGGAMTGGAMGVMTGGARTGGATGCGATGAGGATAGAEMPGATGAEGAWYPGLRPTEVVPLLRASHGGDASPSF